MARLFGDLDGLHVELVRRLQNFANLVGIDLKVNSGYRSIAEQQILYDRYLRGDGPLAARPGNSYHNYRGAADCKFVNGQYPRAYKSKLTQAGLTDPVASEGWHLQIPGWSKAQCMAGPAYTEGSNIPGASTPPGLTTADVRTIQTQLLHLGCTPAGTDPERWVDGVWGPATKAALAFMQDMYNDRSWPTRATDRYIAEDGVWGPDSAYAINWLYAH